MMKPVKSSPTRIAPCSAPSVSELLESDRRSTPSSIFSWMSALLRLNGGCASASPASWMPSSTLVCEVGELAPDGGAGHRDRAPEDGDRDDHHGAGRHAVGEAAARERARRRSQHRAQQQRDDDRQHDDAQVGQRVDHDPDRREDREQPPGDRGARAQPSRHGIVGPDRQRHADGRRLRRPAPSRAGARRSAPSRERARRPAPRRAGARRPAPGRSALRRGLRWLLVSRRSVRGLVVRLARRTLILGLHRARVYSASLTSRVRRIAYSAGAPHGVQPGNARAFGLAASPGGRECHANPGDTHSGDVVVQRRSMTGAIGRAFGLRPGRALGCPTALNDREVHGRTPWTSGVGRDLVWCVRCQRLARGLLLSGLATFTVLLDRGERAVHGLRRDLQRAALLLQAVRGDAPRASP